MLHVLAVLRKEPLVPGTENRQLVDRLVEALREVPLALQCYGVSQFRGLHRIARVAGAQIHPPRATR